MAWEKLQPLSEGQGSGCLTCYTNFGVIADLNKTISVGFGEAIVKKDGEIVYDETDIEDSNGFWTVRRAEEEAAKDPDHDWRIVMHAPFYGVTYQRHGEGNWVLVKKNQGFV